MSIAVYEDFSNLPRWRVARNNFNIVYTATGLAAFGGVLTRPITNNDTRSAGAGLSVSRGTVQVVTKLHVTATMTAGTTTDQPNIVIGASTIEPIAGLIDRTPTALTQTSITETGIYTGGTPDIGALQGCLVSVTDQTNGKVYHGSILSNTVNALTLHGHGFRPDGLTGTGTPGNFRYSVYLVNTPNFVPIISPIYGKRSATVGCDTVWSEDDCFIPLPEGRGLCAILSLTAGHVPFSNVDVYAEGILMPKGILSRTNTRFQPS